MNIASLVREHLCHLRIKILPEWVKGHQNDKTPWEELTWQAKMNVRSDRLAGKYLQYRAAFLHFPKLRISHLYKNPRHLFRWTRCRKTWQNSPPWHQWQVSCHTYIGRRIRHTPTHRLDGILLVRQITPRTPTSTFLSINTWLGSYQPWHIFTDDPPIR